MCGSVCVCIDWYSNNVAQSHKPINTHTATHTSMHSPVVQSKQVSTNKHINVYYGKKFIYN